MQEKWNSCRPTPNYRKRGEDAVNKKNVEFLKEKIVRLKSFIIFANESKRVTLINHL